MSLASVVGKFSPIIGTILNSFFPGSGLVVQGLAHLFGTSSNPDEIATAISADPDAQVKIKQFELEHQDILAKMTQADKASARDMNIETTKATGHTDYVMHLLGIGSFMGCGLYLCVSVFFPKQFDINIWHDLLNFLMLVFSFYFGGMYKQSHIKSANSEVILPPPAQTR